MQAAAQVILDQIKILFSSLPINARLFLVADLYGRGASSDPEEAYNQAVFSGLNELHKSPTNLKVSNVDFSAISSGVLGSIQDTTPLGTRAQMHVMRCATIQNII